MAICHSQATQNYDLFQEGKKIHQAPCYLPLCQISKL